jgi:hypothetical protein
VKYCQFHDNHDHNTRSYFQFNNTMEHIVWKGKLDPHKIKQNLTRPEQVVVDHNNCHFRWYPCTGPRVTQSSKEKLKEAIAGQ